MKRLKIYLLISGIALGSAMGPLHANIFHRLIATYAPALFTVGASASTIFYNYCNIVKEDIDPKNPSASTQAAQRVTKVIIIKPVEPLANTSSPVDASNIPLQPKDSAMEASLQSTASTSQPILTTQLAPTSQQVPSPQPNPVPKPAPLVAETAAAPSKRTSAAAFILGTAAIAGCCYAAYEYYNMPEETRSLEALKDKMLEKARAAQSRIRTLSPIATASERLSGAATWTMNSLSSIYQTARDRLAQAGI